MTDSEVAAALRECEEALRLLADDAVGEDVMDAIRAAIARYGDLREKEGEEKRGKLMQAESVLLKKMLADSHDRGVEEERARQESNDAWKEPGE